MDNEVLVRSILMSVLSIILAFILPSQNQQWVKISIVAVFAFLLGIVFPKLSSFVKRSFKRLDFKTKATILTATTMCLVISAIIELFGIESKMISMIQYFVVGFICSTMGASAFQTPPAKQPAMRKRND